MLKGFANCTTAEAVVLRGATGGRFRRAVVQLNHRIKGAING